MLGVLLFELLTGSLPYRTAGGSAAEIITAINTQETPRASSIQSAGTTRVPAGDLDAILSKALEKAPSRRYGSVESFSADLENYREGRPVAARSLTPVYRLQKYARRRTARADGSGGGGRVSHRRDRDFHTVRAQRRPAAHPGRARL